MSVLHPVLLCITTHEFHLPILHLIRVILDPSRSRIYNQSLLIQLYLYSNLSPHSRILTGAQYNTRASSTILPQHCIHVFNFSLLLQRY